MSEGKVRRARRQRDAHVKKKREEERNRAHTRPQTDVRTRRHAGILRSPLTPRLPFKTQAHTLDILPFFLAGASHGNGCRNPFSTDAGTAVLILNETQSVLPLSACS